MATMNLRTSAFKREKRDKKPAEEQIVAWKVKDSELQLQLDQIAETKQSFDQQVKNLRKVGAISLLG